MHFREDYIFIDMNVNDMKDEDVIGHADTFHCV
jgi:hypothetical protein